MSEGDAETWRVPARQRRRARQLRAAQTRAEQKLWFALRAHRLDGLSFRRQHPIGPVIVDFACVSCRLIVELDGGQHYTPVGMARDASRDAMLARLGFAVLRIGNHDVMENIDGVLAAIRAAARERHG